MTQAILEIEQVSKSFAQRLILDNLTFSVRSGEVFGFLGPNGAGKTTLIKIILGFLSLDSGRILVEGLDIRRDYEAAMARMGGIIENPELYQDLSGQTNLEMSARLHPKVDAARIRAVVNLVGMQLRIRERVKKYSLGMKQRIGLAQALLHQPRLLILDEPTNGLDPAGIRELRDILKHLAHEEGIAVFIASHQLAEMELMCDRIAIINRGSLLGVKPTADLVAECLGQNHPIYRFTTPQSEQAITALRAFGHQPVPVPGQAERSFDLALDQPAVPDMVRWLVGQGFDIIEVSQIRASLEDAYLAITGGGRSLA